jgi:hypothetical protein
MAIPPIEKLNAKANQSRTPYPSDHWNTGILKEQNAGASSPAEGHKSMSSGSKLAAADDIDNQPETKNSGNYVTDDSQGRKAEK